jgi:Cu(I)/Ag(I) efflux system membrane protein CusA/SilA
VLADRVVGKPYLEIDLDRERLARYGLSVGAVQQAIEVAIGGRPLTTTVEGRERYPVRVRYPRELRDTPEAIEQVLVGAPGGAQVPLGQLADVRYAPGPQSIRSEDTQLVAYVTFSGLPGTREVEVVEDARAYLDDLRDSGELELPAGVRYRFAGQFENQVRAAATLRLVLPVALAVIFLLLYLQFRRVWVTGVVFAGVGIAWAGGFTLLWLWGREGFLDLSLAGVSLAELFQTGPVALSVAVWVGFLALFGIATDDGVLMATYLEQRFAKERPEGREAVREATVQAALRRIRPCLMTSATTVLALIPVLTSSGRGSDVMVPMALPTFGGMLVVLLTVFATPTLYC